MIRVRVQSPLTAEHTRAALIAATRAGLLRAVEFWHRVYLPGHFTVAGGKQYGYQKRRGDDEPPRLPRADGKPGTRQNPAYSWRKRRRYRHNRPLVWTGRSEQAAKSSVRLSTARRRAGSIVGVAAMTLPTYFYRYRKDLRQPDKADELTRVTDGEVRVLTTVLNRATARYLAAWAAGRRP